MKKIRQGIIALCPECETEIDLGPAPQIGQNVTCQECWAYLKIVNLDPTELAWDIDEIDEGWDPDAFD